MSSLLLSQSSFTQSSSLPMSSLSALHHFRAVMFDVFQPVKELLSLDPICIDNNIFRLHYKVINRTITITYYKPLPHQSCKLCSSCHCWLTQASVGVEQIFAKYWNWNISKTHSIRTSGDMGSFRRLIIVALIFLVFVA